ncbi:hypothetical protein GIX45_16910 [Erwinia sp. CPCC 100877]|nr:hypothetical protein [Erwinia sp. CPCC 100877]
MNYLIDSYAPYYAGSLLGKVAEVVNWVFVDLPFFILRIFSIGILLIQEMLDQTELFRGKQESAYELSLSILNNLGGKSMVRGSIIALLILISAYYLLYNFFLSKKNFSKVLLHYIAVFLLFVFWFGSIATPSGTQSGGMFLVETASNVFTGIKNGFTSSSSDFSKISSEQALDDTPLFNATIKQTFYYVNTGSLDGTMENGEKIDEKKLLMPNGLSKEEKTKFEKEREKYLGKIEKDNPYVQQNLTKTPEKLMAIMTGGVNSVVTSYPALAVNAMLSVIQLVITMLIIVAPVFFVMSFFPACQSMLFKFFKLLIGALFVPVILGVFLAVFFWANKVIDAVYLSAMKGVAPALLIIMSGGIFILTSNIVLIIIKYFLYKFIWKNKYRLLGYFTDGKVKEPEIIEKVNEKTDAVKDRAKDVTVGGLEVAAGVYTGNPMLMQDGLSRAMPKTDRAMNLGQYRYRDYDDNRNRQNGLDEWVDNQNEDVPKGEEKELENVEFVETDNESVEKQEEFPEMEEIDHSLDTDKMAVMFDELSDGLLEDGDTVSVDNLSEIELEMNSEEMDRIALEQAEQELVVERDEYELDKEYPEDLFFGKEVLKEINEEDWS